MIGRLLNGVAAIAGAASLSQFPSFYAQYVQRLGGNLDYAALALARIEEAAQAVGLTVEAYVRHFAESVDEIVRGQGLLTLQTVEDAERLEAAYDALLAATPLERPLTLSRHFDPEIARSALATFEPSMPISLEGLTYAGVGMLIGLGLLSAVEALARWLNPFRRRRPEAAA